MLRPIRLQRVTWTPLCVLMQLNVRIFNSNLRNSTYLPERNFAQVGWSVCIMNPTSTKEIYNFQFSHNLYYIFDFSYMFQSLLGTSPGCLYKES